MNVQVSVLTIDIKAISSVQHLQTAQALAHCATGWFNHEMKVIAHQTIRMNLPIGLKARFGESGQEFLPIHIILENILPLVASVHDVVNSYRILDPHLARHATAVLI